MVRKILGTVAGIIVAGPIFFLVQSINAVIFGFPKDLDLNDPAAVSEFMANMPTAAFLVVAFGYALGSFVAGWLARKITRADSLIIPLIIGSVLTLAWIGNITMLPHPLWMVVLCFLIYIPFTLLGHRAAR